MGNKPMAADPKTRKPTNLDEIVSDARNWRYADQTTRTWTTTRHCPSCSDTEALALLRPTMTTNRNTLLALKERVEKATGPDRIIDWELTFDGKGVPDNYTASIDAALALVERVLPTWGWEVHQDDDHYQGPLFYWAAVRKLISLPEAHRARGATASLAILSALLAALIAESPDDR